MYTTPNKGSASAPSPRLCPSSISPPPRLLTPRGTRHASSSPTLRLIVKNNKLLLGVVALALTYLSTTSPYERISVERITYDWNSVSSSSTSETTTHTPTSTTTSTTVRIPSKQPLSSFHSQQQQLQKIPFQQQTPFLSPQPIQVHFLADATTPNPTSKFILDGLERSSLVEMTGITIAQLHAAERQLATLQVFERDLDKPLVYIVDWGSMNRDCHLLRTLFQKLNVPIKNPIVLMDFTASHRHTHCDVLEPYENVLQTKRSLVENRYFDSLQNWIHPGQLLLDKSSSSLQHSPLVLRESFVDLIQNVSSTYTVQQKKEGRSTDLLFNWKPGDYSHYAVLRRRVAEQVSILQGNVTSLSDATYVKALLQSKIVVVAQRDEWEDHYRLYESLASGALVLTDPMLALPEGLVNGTNLLVYETLEDLELLLTYYLKHDEERQEIAKRGFAMVMGRHRTWHRMEQILFGEPQTSVDKPYAEAPRKQERPEMKLLEYEADHKREAAIVL
jgi:hypothetical protein